MNIIKFVGGIEKAKNLYKSWDNEATETASINLGVNRVELNKTTLKVAIAQYYLDLVGGTDKSQEIVTLNAVINAKYYNRVNKEFVINRDGAFWSWSTSMNTYLIANETKNEHLVLIKNIDNSLKVVNI